MTDIDSDEFTMQARDRYTDILVPTDGSDAAWRAAERGVEIAAALEASVHAFSVVESAGALKRDQLRVNAEREAEEAVERVESEAERVGVDVTKTIESGVPHESILEHATTADADIIVMGTHGRTGLDHVVIGSITERVVRASPVPVLTIRPEE